MTKKNHFMYTYCRTQMIRILEDLTYKMVTVNLPKKRSVGFKVGNIWVFAKIVVPPNHPFNRVFHYKPSILGVLPLFLETPIYAKSDSQGFRKKTTPLPSQGIFTNRCLSHQGSDLAMGGMFGTVKSSGTYSISYKDTPF